MLNPFVMRKWAALLIPPMLATILFVIGDMYYGMMGGIGFFLIALLLGLLLGTMFLRNPFTAMLEGKGILCINIDSTGILNPFIVRVSPPYIKGRLHGKDVLDVFDRETVHHLAAPVQNSMKGIPADDGGIRITLDNKTYNAARFAMFHYPVILYNEQIGSVITKDWLSNKEKDVFAEHTVLFLNRKMEELTSVVRDFGRYVVELLKPKSALGGSWWIWLLIGGFLLVLAVMFGPQILAALKGAGGAAAPAVKTATSAMGNAPIAPVG